MSKKEYIVLAVGAVLLCLSISVLGYSLGSLFAMQCVEINEESKG